MSARQGLAHCLKKKKGGQYLLLIPQMITKLLSVCNVQGTLSDPEKHLKGGAGEVSFSQVVLACPRSPTVSDGGSLRC